MKYRPLGQTGLQVSPIGLGTVKLGRNQQVKYPQPFELPTDRQVVDLLALAHELGINLLDTAPAYGQSQQRLGRLLNNRNDWLIVSKVGEQFQNGRSQFDFSYQNTVRTIKKSLQELNTDYLDIVLIHSDGQNESAARFDAAIQALQDMKQQGWIRAHGISSKTVKGGLMAAELLDVLMISLSLADQSQQPVLNRAAELNKGILIKKGLQSGHIDAVESAIQYILGFQSVSSLIIGTINPDHLKQNIALAQ